MDSSDKLEQVVVKMVNGAIVFRMGDLKYNSPYDMMVRAIKLGKNREIGVYFNFTLTRHRTDLLYRVRLAKRAGNISGSSLIVMDPSRLCTGRGT
jgi:hypothetical protein